MKPGRRLGSSQQAADQTSEEPAEKLVAYKTTDDPRDMLPQPAVTAVEFMILGRIPERFVGVITALGAEKTQLFFPDIPEKLRRSFLTALWAGYEFAHGIWG